MQSPTDTSCTGESIGGSGSLPDKVDIGYFIIDLERHIFIIAYWRIKNQAILIVRRRKKWFIVSVYSLQSAQHVTWVDSIVNRDNTFSISVQTRWPQLTW